MELTLEERTKLLMRRKGYTFESLSNVLGISAGYLSDIIRGNRSGANYWGQINALLEDEDRDERE